MSKILPTNHYAKIRIIKSVLGVNSPTYEDLNHLTQIIELHLHTENMSPREIAEKYDIQHTNFGMFIKKSLGLKLKSQSESVSNFFKKSGRSITDEKRLYYKKAKFTFNLMDFPQIPGLDLFKKHGIYHPIKNPQGVDRDHMVSIHYGWMNNIDPSIIAHPANCAILLHSDNNSKSSACSISVDELLIRIKDFESNPTLSEKSSFTHSVQFTEKHRQNLSDSMKAYFSENRYIIITDGVTNSRHPTNEPIPEGFWQGMTKRK